MTCFKVRLRFHHRLPSTILPLAFDQAVSCNAQKLELCTCIVQLFLHELKLVLERLFENRLCCPTRCFCNVAQLHPKNSESSFCFGPFRPTMSTMACLLCDTAIGFKNPFGYDEKAYQTQQNTTNRRGGKNPHRHNRSIHWSFLSCISTSVPAWP